MQVLRYCFEEATASFWRGRRSGAMSVMTSAAAIFVLGALLMLTENLERVIGGWESAAELVVYVSDEATGDERAAIERRISASAVARSHTLVSKSDALRRFRADFAELASVIDELDSNPLPASYEVRLQSDPGLGSAVDDFADTLRGAAGVADVRYDREWIARISMGVTALRALGALVVFALVVAAALTVANVVRLAGHTRRGELEIMRLVGAPLAYVRGPFVVEGMLQGGVGAAVALGMLWGAFALGEFYYGSMIATLLSATPATFLPVELYAILLAGGLAVGSVGGMVGARRTARAERTV
ncbi:MAG: ABC transporter permease [Vicinamibacterales bacterium]|nr:ABC transporter permease [Vicinamibacterales bacterium]